MTDRDRGVACRVKPSVRDTDRVPPSFPERLGWEARAAHPTPSRVCSLAACRSSAERPPLKGLPVHGGDHPRRVGGIAEPHKRAPLRPPLVVTWDADVFNGDVGEGFERALEIVGVGSPRHATDEDVRRAREPHARRRARGVGQGRLLRQGGTPDAHGASEYAQLFRRAGRDHPVALARRADEDEPVARVPACVADQMHTRDAYVGHELLDDAAQVGFGARARQAADVDLAVVRLLAGVTHVVNDPFSRTRPVAEGFAAVATLTPASLLLVLVVVKFLATGSK